MSWLSRKAGTEYRLPSAAEWEYALRSQRSSIGARSPRPF